MVVVVVCGFGSGGGGGGGSVGCGSSRGSFDEIDSLVKEERVDDKERGVGRGWIACGRSRNRVKGWCFS